MASQSKTAAAGTVIPPAKLAHVVFRTSNFKPMVAFYKAFLGAHASYENDNVSFLTYDDEHHRVAIAAMPDSAPKNPKAVGFEHMAFTFNTIEDLLLAYEARKARGIVPWWTINHGPTISMYYQDPDGNKIETQVDNFETAEEATAFFSTAAFAENYVGVDIDPEDLLRRIRNGEDEKELKKRGDIGPRGFESIPPTPAPVVKDSYEVLPAAA